MQEQEQEQELESSVFNEYTRRNYLEKQLMLLMPLLRGTSCRKDIIELEARVVHCTKELEELDARSSI
mgnify:CR=1 FL=1|tara:strand:+ start:347 stop:550 length:204 start_codon:yes stop_codon:yes gene_type:complete